MKFCKIQDGRRVPFEIHKYGIGDIAFLVLLKKRRGGGRLGFQKLKFLWYFSKWVVTAKFGLLRIKSFDVIAILVNFNWIPAAILDFEIFYFWP